MIVKEVEVNGFWGRSKIELKMYPDVTILIGANGTGKTTLINLLIGALNADFEILSRHKFNQICIQLIDPLTKKKRQIKITRSVNLPFDQNIYTFQVGTSKYCLTDDIRMKIKRRALSGSQYLLPLNPEEAKLRRVLKSLVDISWISVYREVPISSPRDEVSERKAIIDQRLHFLTQRLAEYLYKIENLASEKTKKFQQDVILSSLEEYKFSSFPKLQTKFEETNVEELESGLSRAFEQLDIHGEDKKLHNYCVMINDCIKNMQTKEGGINIHSLLNLVRAESSLYMNQLLEVLESNRAKIRLPISKFLSTVHEFMKNKHVSLESESSKLTVHRKTIDGQIAEKISLYDLSSGEKQLLIQLLEALLQEGKSSIFIADEPELSLHLEWQQKLIDAVLALNSNSQIIVATHSPEIVSHYSNRVINMEGIIHDTKPKKSSTKSKRN
ncbi:MAG: AAA family ATPase [Phycisphaerae bacterium]|nr:AAA family ATPase [Phycisphaerae bacterium]